MGVVNVTPDSFSDGGRWFEPDAAIAHGLELVGEGADIVDVGGESTRPGAERPPVAEELRRVLPVIRALAAADAASASTPCGPRSPPRPSRPAPAWSTTCPAARPTRRCCGLVAEAGVPYVCMHWRGHSEDMQSRAIVRRRGRRGGQPSWRSRSAQAERAGIAPDRLILDPGFGFAKTGEHNWELLQRLDELDRLGRPLLLGRVPQGVPRHAAGRRDRPARGRPQQRDDATTALTFAARPATRCGAFGCTPSGPAGTRSRSPSGCVATLTPLDRPAFTPCIRGGHAITSSPVCWRGIGGAYPVG